MTKLTLKQHAAALAQQRLDFQAQQAEAEAQQKAEARARRKSREQVERIRSMEKAQRRQVRKAERRKEREANKAAAKERPSKNRLGRGRAGTPAKKAQWHDDLIKVQQQEGARRRRGEIRANTPLEVRRQDRVAQLAQQFIKGKLLDKGRASEELEYLASIDVASWQNVDRARYQFVWAILRSIEKGSSPDIQQPDGKYFRWPATLVGEQARSGSVVETFNEVGVLKSMGYQVGVHGLPSNERRRLLNLIFERELKLALPPAYLSEWGRPGTPTRLRKLAHTIAALTRNMKRRSADAPSIEEWEEDLAYLKQRFYIGRFSFDWPRA